MNVTLGMWLSLIGGILQLAGVGVASFAAWRAYVKADMHMGVLRESLRDYKAKTEAGTDHSVAAAEMAAYREARGVVTDATYDDILHIKTLITYLVSRSAALSVGLTVGFLAIGIILSTVGSLLGSPDA